MVNMKIALIGYGYWGKIVSKYLINNPNYELKKIYSPSLENKGIFTNDINEIWNNKDISVVFIATPIKTHYTIVKEALKNNKHVFCEKPLTNNYSEALEIEKLANAKNLLVETDYIYTISKSIQKIKEILDDVSNISYVELSMKQLGRFYDDDVYDVLGSHMISILDYLFSIDEMNFKFRDLIVNKNKIVETGEIMFSKGNLKGRIIVSLNHYKKERNITIYGDNTIIRFDPFKKDTLLRIKYKKNNKEAVITNEEYYSFNESDNIEIMLNNFHDKYINKKKSNINQSLAITKVLSTRK